MNQNTEHRNVDTLVNIGGKHWIHIHVELILTLGIMGEEQNVNVVNIDNLI